MKKIDSKAFAKQLLIYILIFTVILIPVNIGLNKLGGVRIFSGTASIMKDMNYIIDPDSPFYDEFKDSERVNVLVLGLNDGMTDVMMVGSYDLKNQRVDIISVPRDTYYYREGRKGASLKINAIYSSQGIIETATAVSDVLLGMPINYYAIIDYADVRAIVDSMGGIPIDIPFTMKYDDVYDNPPLHIYIEKGQQTLDGEEAVEYLRYRHGYNQGDIGRVNAHQVFVKAAFKQALSSGIVDVAKVAAKEVESDISLGMAVKIATKAIGLDPEAMKTWMAPGKSGTTNGLSYWYVSQKEMGKMIEEIYGDPVEATTGGAVEE